MMISATNVYSQPSLSIYCLEVSLFFVNYMADHLDILKEQEHGPLPKRGGEHTGVPRQHPPAISIFDVVNKAGSVAECLLRCEPTFLCS